MARHVRSSEIRRVLAGLSLTLAILAPASTPARGQVQGVVRLIVVGDTLDPKIGPSVEADVANITGVFKAQLDSQLLTWVPVIGVGCHPDGILAAIRAMPVGPGDALVVYVSGHGAHDRNAGHYLKFPRLGGHATLTRERIRQEMQARGGRLRVLLTDSCNQLSNIPGRPPAMAAPMPGAEPPRISPLFRSLLFETIGFVDVNSSEKDEAALCYPSERPPEGFPNLLTRPAGGIFTVALMNTLRGNEQLSLTWQQVIEKVGGQVRREFRRLRPDGIDKEDEPERPQMTQTVLAYGLGTPSGRIPPQAPPPGEGPPNFEPAPMRSWARSLGAFAHETGGRGLTVWGVRPGGPAARLGLARGDVLLAVNDAPIRTARGLAMMIQEAGLSVDLAYRKGGPGGPFQIREVALDDNDRGAGGGETSFGASVEPDGRGVRVVAVRAGSPAELAGVEPGDVLIEADGRPVRGVADYVRAFDDGPPDLDFATIDVRDPARIVRAVASLRGKEAVNPFRPPGGEVPPIAGEDFQFGVFGIDAPGGVGVTVWTTRPGSPAQRIGLEHRDVIVEIDGAPIRNVREYAAALGRARGRIRVVVRDIRTGLLRPTDVDLAGVRRPAGRTPLGVFSAPARGGGVVITAIAQGSPAAAARLAPSDVILQVNGRPVHSPEDLARAVDESPPDMWYLLRNNEAGGTIQGMVAPLDR